VKRDAPSRLVAVSSNASPDLLGASQRVLSLPGAVASIA
jgi:hypothetical protein